MRDLGLLHTGREMNIKLRALALVIGIIAAPAALSAVTTINLYTEVTDLTLTSSSPVAVPLVSDPFNALPDTVDGYGFALAEVTLTESTTFVSMGSMHIVIDDPTDSYSTSFADNGTAQFSFATTLLSLTGDYSLYLDASLTDVDPDPGRDFATASPLVLEGTKPLEFSVNAGGPYTLSQALSFFFVPFPFATTSIGAAEYDLGVDVNGMGGPDILSLEALDISINPKVGEVLLAVDTLMKSNADALAGNDTTIDIEFAIPFKESTATLAANIFDGTFDPPFELTLTTDGSIVTEPLVGAAVPLPPAVLLFAAGCVSLVFMRRAALA